MRFVAEAFCCARYLHNNVAPITADPASLDLLRLESRAAPDRSKEEEGEGIRAEESSLFAEEYEVRLFRRASLSREREFTDKQSTCICF